MKKKEKHGSAPIKERTIEDVVAVDQLLLKDEFSKLPSDLAHYNEQFAEALRTFLRCERRRKETFARLYIETREAAEEKMSEAMLKATVESDEEYEQACQNEIAAEVSKARLWGMCEAIRAKKDALISIGAHVRAELGGDPSLRDRARGMRDVDASKPIDDD